MKKNITTQVVCLLICLCQITGMAQKASADKVYDQLGYKEAIELYRAGKLTEGTMERIANGYRLNHDTQNAEKWYAQIADDSDNPLNTLYYAQALHSNGNLEKAKEYYLKYDRVSGGGDRRGAHLANAIDRISNFRDNEKIQVELASAINSPKLDFSPIYFQDGVVFVSNRSESSRDKDLWTGDGYNTHFFAEENADGSLGAPEPFSLQLDEKFHEGPLTFSKSGDEVFFTRNIAKRNKKKEYSLQIFTALQKGEDFGDAKKIDFSDAQANDAHPALSPDGQYLYFASDREGGLGGMDIWRSSFSDGKWGEPANLGPKVNTAGNEVFPFVYDDGTVYFASDGWGGLGGLDVFYVEQMETGGWADPINIGTPINSNKDDFSYTLNALGTEGYFTSAREGGQGKDDIYHFVLAEPQGNKKKEKKIFANICVYDEATGERLPDVKVNVLAEAGDGSYQGFEDNFVVNLVPTGNNDEFMISFKRSDPFGDAAEENTTYTTDQTGFFDMEAKAGRNYILMAKADGYQDGRLKFLTDDLTSQSGELCIPMTTNGDCVMLKGQVTNSRFGNFIPNANMTLIDLCTGETMTAQSDEAGYYQFPCLPCECDFIVKAEKANFKSGSGMASTLDMDCAAGGVTMVDIELYPAFSENGEPLVASYNENPNRPPYPSGPNPSGYNPNQPIPNRPPGYNSAPSYDPSRSGGEILEEGVTLNIKDIYYDFDEDYIRGYDAAPDLDHLANVLLRHPNLLVELSSHTDSRGTHEYNADLSDRRAKAAVEYIVKKGVERHRIVSAQGFGEAQLLNECADGVDCTEAAHQMNRRTEVKLYGQF